MRTFLTSRLYIGAVIAAGAGLLLYLAPRELENPIVAGALLVATLVLSVFKLRLPLGNGVSTMSMAYAVDFVALIIEGANLAMLLGAIGVLIQCTVRVRRKQPIHRAAFSAAAVIIAVQVAGWGWNALGGSLTTLTMTTTVLPLMACAITYFIVNTSLVVGAIAVTSSVSPAQGVEPGILAECPGLPGLRPGCRARRARHYQRRVRPAAARRLAALCLLPRLSPALERHGRRAARGNGAARNSDSRLTSARGFKRTTPAVLEVIRDRNSGSGSRNSDTRLSSRSLQKKTPPPSLFRPQQETALRSPARHREHATVQIRPFL